VIGRDIDAIRDTNQNFVKTHLVQLDLLDAYLMQRGPFNFDASEVNVISPHSDAPRPSAMEVLWRLSGICGDKIF